MFQGGDLNAEALYRQCLPFSTKSSMLAAPREHDAMTAEPLEKIEPLGQPGIEPGLNVARPRARRARGPLARRAPLAAPTATPTPHSLRRRIHTRARPRVLTTRRRRLHLPHADVQSDPRLSLHKSGPHAAALFSVG